MRLDKLTIKAQEALAAAQGIAEENGSQIVEPLHLLKALLDQAEGIVRRSWARSARTWPAWARRPTKL